MALITGKVQLKEGFLKEEKHSSVYIEIDKKYLSKAYELPKGAKIVGEIRNVQVDDKLMEELIGKGISFILVPVFGMTDHLYISEDSWKVLRDYAILPEESWIDVKLEKAVINEKEIPLYSKRDKWL